MPDPAANAPETEAKKSRGLGSYVVWGFVVVIVYVLGSGPAMRYDARHPKSELTGIVYWPVRLVYEYTPLHKPLGMYWHLWCPARYDSDGNH